MSDFHSPTQSPAEATGNQKMIAVLEKYGILWRAYHTLEAAVDHTLYELIYGNYEADTKAAYEFAQERIQAEADRAAAR